MNKTWIVIGAMLGLIAVATGAIGDHMMRPKLTEWYPDDAAKRIENWEIASRYLFFHALAILVVGLLPAERFRRSQAIIGGLFVLGTILFSGCLFAYAITNQKPLVHLVPFGGVSFMAGWLALMVSAAIARPAPR